MFTELGGVTSQLLSVALDAASARHSVIANNIANSDTAGFHAKGLRFESELQGVVSDIQNGQSLSAQRRIGDVDHQLQSGDSIYKTNEPVELDQEMVHLAENTILYQALLHASSKRGDLVRMAINGGRS